MSIPTPTTSESCACNDDCKQTPSFLGRESNQPDSGNDLNSTPILQINVEGWTTAKREILQHLCHNYKPDAVLVQETHQIGPDKLKLHGYTLAAATFSKHHGIATFVRNNIKFEHVCNSANDDITEWTTTQIMDIIVTNVYHPPTPAILDPTKLPLTRDHHIISGDFNCHHELWGYSDNNKNGRTLANWCSNNNLTILFDPKQPASFEFGRWRSKTNPDVTFSTPIRDTIPTRTILDRFPRSQHRPSLIQIPPLIFPTTSTPVPRWNFRKADWSKFKQLCTGLAEQLPLPCKTNINSVYQVFTSNLKAAARLSIPRGFRKSYIPTWDENCSNLYKNYLDSQTNEERKENASALIEALGKNRQNRWIDTVTSIDFRHSSRKA